MNIFVLLKQVPDTETKIRLKGDNSGIESGDIKWIVSPYDEFAIEEGLKTKEANGGTVTVLTAGPDRCVEALRTALAMGADNAMHVKTDGDNLDTFQVAKALAAVLKQNTPDLVFAGKQAIDDDQAAVFGYVAEFLDIPSVSVVIKVEMANDKKSLRAHREVDGGAKHIIESTLPCLVAVNKGINSPRYASLPGIMKAKKKEIKTFTLADLGVAGETARVSESAYAMPPERSAGKKIEGDAAAQAKELVRLLREEAKVI
ncbi:MAG: electron transfer flavoprotein subunit beta/FixA family protein [Bdellovibrionaceae bacterium]|nr:electron transfer flavoprotein subunit beta/FixA family protein [Bdellovibrionales bacterium]MCB9254315.1 electron transfer flavoprotein subunit beta/FixA family protein [Pseudobdellovibrionaceae bacterium]